MAKQGAALQTYNNELVKSLEELCQRRHALQIQIDAEQAERDSLEAERQRIEERLQSVEHSLKQKLTTRSEYDRVIGEAEQAYMKILESSQVLLNVVKSRSKDLKATTSKQNAQNGSRDVT